MRKIFTLLLWIVTVDVSAQKAGDSLELFRLFTQVSTNYQQMPLHAVVDIKKTSSYVNDNEDTMHTSAEFFIQRDGSYIRFGELEQIAGDSLLLFVSNDAKKMLLYPNHNNVAQQLASVAGLPVNEASIAKLAKRFRAEPPEATGDKQVIAFNSRSVLYGTDLPKESIRLVYDAATQTPKTVLNISRVIVPINKEVYDRLLHEKSLVFVKDDAFYVVKESVTTYEYISIDHKEQKLPFRIADKIKKNDAGQYEPLVTYRDYSLTTN